MMGDSRWSLRKDKVIQWLSPTKLNPTQQGVMVNTGHFPNFAIFWRGKPRGFYLCLAHSLRWSWWF